MMSCVMKLCVVLLNQIMAADVKTQHIDVPQFLVNHKLTTHGFSLLHF